ncbi:MAG: glycosyltransferase family 39 protein [Planctomycetes bacterium]|nr:glycosyltransferase family 39 protein [Planctomycetota bacterium]
MGGTPMEHTDETSVPRKKRRAEGGRMRGWNFKVVLMGGLLAAVTVAAYLPAMGCGFIWDDDDYVTANTTLRDLDGLKRIWTQPDSLPQWYPAVHTTFWVEHHLWGFDPFGYHLVNVLLHCFSSLLLWAILRRLEIPGAYLAAAIFALHPVHVESVAWITERKNVLSGLFYLGAALAYLKFSPPRSAGPAWRSWPFLALAAALFVLALLSKTVTASLPAAILLVLWWRRGRVAWGDLAALIPLLIIGAAMGMHTAEMERLHVGAVGPEWDRTFMERCIVAAHAVWFYAGKLVWPAGLTFLYPRWAVNTGDWIEYTYLAGLCAAAAAAVAIAVRMRTPAGRAPLAAGLFFVGTLFPALGFFNVYPHRFSFVADHFQYLASIGLIVLAAGIFAAIAGRLTAPVLPDGPPAKLPKYAPAAAACLIVAALAGLTAMQGRLYANLEELWFDTLRKNPGCWLAWNNLGFLYTKSAALPDQLRAIDCFRKSLQIDARNEIASYNIGYSMQNLGNIERQKRNYRQADEYRRLTEKYYRQAIEFKPNYAAAHNALGILLNETARRDEALEHLALAAKYVPNYFEFAFAYATVLLQAGRTDQAVAEFLRAENLNPSCEKILFNLATAYITLGQYSPAAEALEKCRRINPAGHAVANRLAWLLATCPDESVRDPAGAVRLAHQACQAVRYADTEYLETLAAAQARAGQYDQAVKTASSAIEQARSAGKTALAGRIAAQRELYRSGRPYTQPRNPAAAAASAPATRPASQP